MLYGETLWNDFRILKLEEPDKKLVLIKSSERILQTFLCRFYELSDRDVHKIGTIPLNKLHILRLNEKAGTY